MSRGSRKHVLDWTDQPKFFDELRELVAPVDCRLAPDSSWMPRGYGSPAEARLETFGPEALPNAISWSDLRRWWLVHERGANTPNWDIAASCEIEGEPGLILVEAKANVPELSVGGKALEPGASAASVENHDRIGLAIDEACAALQQTYPSTRISRGSHYQLSNRVAFAWKLASLGLPTILVYLGFCGDDGITDAGLPIANAAHWEAVFEEYAKRVVPTELLERRVECGAAPMWLLVRSRLVSEPSPPRPSKKTPHES